MPGDVTNPQVPAGDRASNQPGPRVLIVDDETLVRNLLAVVLERAGYRVLKSGCAAEALAVLRDHPDTALALVDISLPDRMGLDLLPELAALQPRLVALITTGHDIAALKGVAMHASVRGVLQKPFLGDRLLSAVRFALEEAG